MGIFLSLDLIVFFVFWELHARPDVLPHRGLGQRAARVRGDEVLPLHDGRLGVPARVDPRARRSCTRADDRRTSRSTSGSSPSGTGSSGTTETWLFLGFMIAFAIKAPLFPFHTWLPDVHTEAPTAGSVVLAGVHPEDGRLRVPALLVHALPAGVGRLRAAAARALAVIGIIYGSIVARDADGPETAHRVLVGRAHGLRRARHLLAHDRRASTARVVHHAEPPAHHRRALPPRRHALRAPPHARDQSEFGGIWKAAPVLGGLFLVATFAGIGAARASPASSASSWRCSARSCRTAGTRSWPRSA